MRLEVSFIAAIESANTGSISDCRGEPDLRGIWEVGPHENEHGKIPLLVKRGTVRRWDLLD
jgi:hypothetical protein